jgi:hypothetical protein
MRKSDLIAALQSQKQADESGEFCIVSRQAVDETVKALCKLHSALERLVGQSTEQDLKETRLGLLLVPMPENERAVMLNAIDTLLEFHNA